MKLILYFILFLFLNFINSFCKYLQQNEINKIWNIYKNYKNHNNSKYRELSEKILIKNYERLCYYYMSYKLQKKIKNKYKYELLYLSNKAVKQAIKTYNLSKSSFPTYLKKVAKNKMANFLCYNYFSNSLIRYPENIKINYVKIYLLKKNLNINKILPKHYNYFERKIKLPIKNIIKIENIKYKINNFIPDYEYINSYKFKIKNINFDNLLEKENDNIKEKYYFLYNKLTPDEKRIINIRLFGEKKLLSLTKVSKLLDIDYRNVKKIWNNIIIKFHQ